jgi:hypothetical protein
VVDSFPKILDRWRQPRGENETAVADLRLPPVAAGFGFGTALDVFDLLEGVLLHSFPRSRSSSSASGSSEIEAEFDFSAPVLWSPESNPVCSRALTSVPFQIEGGYCDTLRTSEAHPYCIANSIPR